MEQLSLTQGSPEWHAHRASHFNASDAPAMLGISKYKTRTQLLHEMATGITPEIDAATQRRFDDGHRFESLARPLAESIIGKKLYPVTGAEGKLSASFDGLTADDNTCWEHKTLNDTLHAALSRTTGEDLPEQYRAQMEQQFMVSGAERCLFMASRWDSDGGLAEELHGWYESDQIMRERILQGWTQFAIDLEEYKRKMAAGEIEQPKEMPKAEVTIDLPALFVHARGEITTHNMDEFGHALTAKLAEVRAIALITDQDFSNAKDSAKKFRETAKAIAISKEQMLAQTETIGEAARKMDAWAKDLNATALKLEKDVEREDMAKKTAMVNAASVAFAEHVAALEVETKPIRLTTAKPDFALAMKGKRNYASMQDAVDTALSQAKASADAEARDVRSKLAWCKETSAGYGFLFADLAQIIGLPMEDFQLTITSRIESHRQAEAKRQEEERAKMEAEATAKAEREAAAKMAAEEARIRADEQAKVKAEAEQRAQTDSARPVPATSFDQVVRAIVPEPIASALAPAAPSNVVEISHHPVGQPSRGALIAAVQEAFGATYEQAHGWLTAAFGQEAA